MIHMEERHKKILWDILKKYPYTFYAFGSRVTGKHRRFSDLDLFLNEPIKVIDSVNLEEDLGESDLPFTVDVVNKEYCKEDFIKSIKNTLAEVNKKTLGIKDE